jgi:transposase InsO family protein
MSRRGSAYDNAAMESWFSTMTFELDNRFETHTSAKAKLFDYIEVFYNQERRHSKLGYVSPAQFERAARMGKAAA